MFKRSQFRLLFFIFALFIFICPTRVSAMTMSEIGCLPRFDDNNYLYSSLDDGGIVCFCIDKSGIMHLLGADGQDYLSFIPYDTRGAGGLEYVIKKIKINSGREFWQITASVGAHDMNCGYWIVGKVHGKYVSMVSLANFAALGYTPDKWHNLYGEVKDGELIVTSSHPYFPPGAIYGYQARRAIDWQGRIYWDKAANWFGIEYIR